VLRDRDAVYGVAFSSRARTMGIHEAKTAPRSPWQNSYVERLIGTLRRECLDHVLVLNETHLRRLLSAYLIYYHRARTHLSLAKDAPEPRPVECLRAVPATLTSPVGACASVRWNPLLGGSARSPRWSTLRVRRIRGP
jgi:transposase InsO family protein